MSTLVRQDPAQPGVVEGVQSGGQAERHGDHHGRGHRLPGRDRRLIAAPRPASRPRVAGGFAAIAGLLTLPVLLFTGPAATAMPRNSCETSADCATRTVDCPPMPPERHM